MRQTILKQSMLEPNFAFGLASGDGQGGIPASSDYTRANYPRVPLHKTDQPLANFRMSSVEEMAAVGHDSSRLQLYNHCHTKWTLYIILILGFVSISGCIAAGVALSAVQPYLVEGSSETATTPYAVLFPDFDNSDPLITSDVSPSVLSRIFSPVRDAGMQETHLELRNLTKSVTDVPSQSTTTQVNLNLTDKSPPDIAAPSMREFFATMDSVNIKEPDVETPSPPTMLSPPPSTGPSSSASPTTSPALSTFHTVETISERDKLLLTQKTARFTMEPRSRRTTTVSPLFYFDFNYGEPDKFLLPKSPDGINPLAQDLNITFVDPFPELPTKPLVLNDATRKLTKRSVAAAVANSVGKPAPPLNFGQFTMLKPSVKTVDVFAAKIDITGDGRPLEPKALLPEPGFRGLCESGFDWDPISRECRDIDECLQMGIRACGVNSECSNMPGTYTCRCSPGFRLDPKSLVCIDIDECLESNGDCSPLARCINLPGGFICRCSEGFYGNGIVCEIDGSGVVDRRDTVATLPCQAVLPPRSHQIIASPYYPDMFPVHSRYKYCAEKMRGICKMGVIIRHFLPTSVGHQDFDYLTVQGKVITGADQNGQILWLLDSGEMPVEIEFATDSDPRGNRFTMELTQDLCGQSILVPECMELLNVQENSITSAGPHYIDNLACTTALYPPSEACGMELKFHEFALEGPRESCTYDFLEINDDKLCGNMKNELREIIFPRNTPKIPIIFSTDGSFVSVGFNITFSYITECYQYR